MVLDDIDESGVHSMQIPDWHGGAGFYKDHLKLSLASECYIQGAKYARDRYAYFGFNEETVQLTTTPFQVRAMMPIISALVSTLD